MNNKAPQLEPDAAMVADTAYIALSGGNPRTAVHGAIRAYLWALENDGGQSDFVYPSLADTLEALK